MTFDKKVCLGYIGQMKQLAPEQARAARAWLGWSQADLAAKAHVGLSTIKDFEGGNRTPIANNLAAIQQALEGAGVELVFDPKGTPKGLHVNGRSR
jgi:ribosome-binding protein aMBF1 (putative translation factor)